MLELHGMSNGEIAIWAIILFCIAMFGLSMVFDDHGRG